MIDSGAGLTACTWQQAFTNLKFNDYGQANQTSNRPSAEGTKGTHAQRT